jgi:hypothetical protein
MYEEEVGLMSMATNEDNTDCTNDVVLWNRQVTVDEVANWLQISYDSAYEIIHNSLHKKKWNYPHNRPCRPLMVWDM